MKKFSMILLVLLFLLTREVPPKAAYATTNATPTATPVMASLPSAIKTLPTVKRDNRVEALKTYLLMHNSPLAEYASDLVEQADKNGIDWRLVAAISGNESGFGLALIPGSYNAWGYGIYGSHVTYFSSYSEAIAVISTALKDNYIDRLGTNSVYAIGSMYAADPAWANKVSMYMSQIENFAESTSFNDASKELQLTL